MNPRPSRPELLALAAILLLAGLLRMGWPGLAEFKADEAHLLNISLDLAEGRRLPLRGIEFSIGLPHPPISVYLYALPLLPPFARTPAERAPLAAGLFVGALNTLSIAVTWAVGRRYFGRRAGLLAALLYAASPWAVVYSRKIWANDLLPLFVTGWAACGLLALVEGRRRWLAPCLVLLALAAQIHLSALALVPATGLALLVFRRRVGWRQVGWGALLSALTGLPFGVYLLQHRANLLPALASLSGHPARFTGNAFWQAWMIAAGANLHSLAGPQAFRAYLQSIPPPELWVWPLSGLLLAGIVALVRWAIRRRSAPEGQAAFFLLLWLAFPVLLFVRASAPVYPHYFMPLFPVPYLAAGVALSDLASRIGRRAYASDALAVAVAGMQAAAFLALLALLARQATPDGFGTPLALQQRWSPGCGRSGQPGPPATFWW
ncbi:MAG: glycosyltransferase family 39 protein [Chloroflexi bacterium]|nr:glycosyltransferase family 39 protein [Chloroflexota bacterium]